MKESKKFAAYGGGGYEQSDDRPESDFLWSEEDEAETKQQRRGSGRLRRWLFLILIVAFLVAGLAFVPRIEYFSVTGTQGLTAAEVMEKCGLAAGQHLFSIDRDAVAEAIETDPHYIVQDMFYHFPNRLEIKVSERSRDACVRYLDRDIIIASDGMVLEVGQIGSFPDILRLQGVSVTGYALGESIGVQDDFQLSIAGKVLDALRSTGYVVDYDLIDLSNPVDIRLLSKNRITVRIGQMENIEEKLAKSAFLLRQLANDGYYGGVLDASTEKPAYRDSSSGGIEIPQELLTGTEIPEISLPEIPIVEEAGQQPNGNEQVPVAGGPEGSNSGVQSETSQQSASPEDAIPDLPEEGDAGSGEGQGGQGAQNEGMGPSEGELPGLAEEGE